MNNLREEEEEQLNKNLRDICQVLLHGLLHDKLHKNELTCRDFWCDSCPFKRLENFANWVKSPNTYNFLEEEE